MARKNRTLPKLTPQQIQTFWSKVAIAGTDECWLWQGYIAKKSRYGLTCLRKSKAFVVSRVAFFLHFGIDPGEKLVCHTCDVRHCCNPAHLFIGTDADNVHDMMAKGRDAFGEKAWSHENPEHFAKLGAETVRAIREQATTGIAIAVIADLFGIAYNTAYDIVLRRTWKHIGDESDVPPRDRIRTAARGKRHGSKLHPERVARGIHNGAHTHPEKVRKGEQVEHLVKLTEEQVIEIRSRYVPRLFGLKRLASEYDVHLATIHSIITRKTWKHVP